MSKSEVAALVRQSDAAINQAKSDKQQAIQDWQCAYVSTVGLVSSRLLSACIWHGLGLLKAEQSNNAACQAAVRLLDEGLQCMALMGYALWDCDEELRQALRLAFGDAIAPCYGGEVHPTAPQYLPGLREVYTALAAALAAMPTKPAAVTA